MPPDAAASPSSGQVAGSFRDPSGYVFWREGRLFRAVDPPTFQALRALERNGLLAELIQAGHLVRTETVPDGPLLDALRAEHPAHPHFLEHQPLASLTWPHEWTVAMLADAGVHTLDLQLRLLEAGCALKDATPYNVQFVRGRPVFIDAGSFERPRRLDVWFALGQFLQTFLYPLLLCRYRGWDLRSYFLGRLGGRTVEEVARGFGWLGSLRPAVFLDLTLPLWLHRWAEKGQRARREVLERRRDNPRAQALNLRRLRRKIARLAAGYRPRGVWAGYAEACNYDAGAEQAKKRLVAEFLDTTRPGRVLDIGCNTGDYSRLAAEREADVVAVDADHDAVDLLYRSLRQAPAAITPLVVDVASPSPGVGHLNRERASFLDRYGSEAAGGADTALALALLHHLLVSANLSLTAACDLLAGLTRRDLVLEFVPPDDSNFQRLMKFRVDLFGDLTLAACRQAFLERFELLRETPVPGSRRTLLFLRKR